MNRSYDDRYRNIRYEFMKGRDHYTILHSIKKKNNNILKDDSINLIDKKYIKDDDTPRFSDISSDHTQFHGVKLRLNNNANNFNFPPCYNLKYQSKKVNHFGQLSFDFTFSEQSHSNNQRHNHTIILPKVSNKRIRDNLNISLQSKNISNPRISQTSGIIQKKDKPQSRNILTTYNSSEQDCSHHTSIKHRNNVKLGLFFLKKNEN